MPSKKADFELDRTFTHRLHTLSKLTDRVSQAAYQEAIGIPLNEARCLSAVGAFSPLSVNDLAHLANLTKGQASRAAQTLVDQGLVDKQTSAVDGRGVVLNLTPQGQALWRKLKGEIKRRNQQIVACLDEAQRRQLDAILDTLVTHARTTLGYDVEE